MTAYAPHNLSSSNVTSMFAEKATNYHDLLHCNGCSLKIKLNLSVTISGGDNLFKYTNFRPMVVESLEGWTESAIHKIIATY